MKKIKKLTFEQLSEEMSVISHDSLNSFVGGEGIDGYCLFYAMQYLSGGQCDMSYFLNAYGQSFGYGDVLPNSTGYIPGISSSNAASFVAQQFSASSLGPNGGIEAALSQGKKIITDKDMGNGTSHAIIITGTYFTGDYTYYDPMTQSTGIVSSSSINTSMLMAIN